MNTQENNILIAEFMGKEYYSEFGVVYIKTSTEHSPLAKYDYSWDWLMPVVEKIESLFNDGIDVSIFTDGTVITQYRKTQSENLGEGVEIVRLTSAEIGFSSKIEHVYNAVIEFIKWYNKQ